LFTIVSAWQCALVRRYKQEVHISIRDLLSARINFQITIGQNPQDRNAERRYSEVKALNRQGSMNIFKPQVSVDYVKGDIIALDVIHCPSHPHKTFAKP
jgi:hypothetical protein